MSNVAFFPFFPYLWRWLHLSDIGISIFNFGIYITGCLLLFRHFPAPLKVRALSIACSLVLFYLIPYSESCFFLFTTIMLIGLKRQRVWIVLLGLTLMGFTRSIGILFCPAFILLGIVRFIETKDKKTALPFILYGLYSLMVMFSVFGIQYFQTGVWMAFSKAQKFWSTSWRTPELPLSTWEISSQNNIFIEQFALFIGLLSVIYTSICFVRLVKSKGERTLATNTWLSLFYFSAVTLLMLFTRGGSFVSINRYVLSVPFLYFFIIEIHRARLTITTRTGIALLAIVYLLIWHMGTSMAKLLMFIPFLATIFIFPYLLKKETLLAKAGSVAFIVFTIYVQAVLVTKFATAGWVG